MQEYFIDTTDTNLQIHANTGGVDFWLQTPVEGLDFPDVRTKSSDSPGEDGGSVSGYHHGMRLVSLRGVFKGDDVTQYENNRKMLAKALAIRRDSNGTPTPIRSMFRTVTGEQYYFDAFLARKPNFDWDGMKWGKFFIQLIAPDTPIYGSNEVITSRIYAPTSGGTTLPWTLPVTLLPGNTSKVVAINAGNMTSLPLIKLVGPLTNPLIVNEQTGLYMKLDYTIASGDFVEVHMGRPHRILLNGTSPLISQKAVGSDWWGLEPGDNLISIQSDSLADTGYAELYYFDAYVGI